MATDPLPPPPIELTDAEKAVANEWCTKLRLGELVAKVWPGEKPDGRTLRGKALQAYLAGIDKRADTTASLVGNADLTDAQKAQVDSLMKGGRVKTSMEMAKLIFPDRVVKNLSKEQRSTFAYMREHYPDSFAITDEPVAQQTYEPPDRLQVLIGVVNTFVMTGDATRKAYNPSALKVSDERSMKALMGYMRVYRFKYVATTYEKQVDRDLFISTFIRWTHNKADLTESEVDQMISAAAETVSVAQMEREIQDIRRYQESVMAGEVTDENGKQRRFGMTDVEMINGTRTKHDQAKGRLKTLMDALEESRSKRHGAMKDRNASILNLFEAWRNDPEWREDIIGMGKREKEEDRAEVRKIRDMDDLVALISGQTEEEASA